MFEDVWRMEIVKDGGLKVVIVVVWRLKTKFNCVEEKMKIGENEESDDVVRIMKIMNCD